MTAGPPVDPPDPNAPRLPGDHAANLPYEDVPDGPIFRQAGELADQIAGSVVIVACTIPVPEVGMLPAFLFTFTAPDGTTLPTTLLVLDDADAANLPGLTYKAVQRARSAAREANE